jgi:hypothetical protein
VSQWRKNDIISRFQGLGGDEFGTKSTISSRQNSRDFAIPQSKICQWWGFAMRDGGWFKLN